MSRRQPPDRGSAPVPPVTAEAGPGEEGFAARWSRRKLAAGREQPPPAPSPVRDPPAGAVHAPPPESPAEAPAEADLPPVDKLTEDSDLSAFFSPRVSEELRTLALRRLFGMPKFNLRDGLDDYDGDYRNFAPLGEVMTADLRHRLEVEAARVQAALAAEPARNGSQAEDSPPMEVAAGEAGVAGAPGADTSGADTPGVDTEEPS